MKLITFRNPQGQEHFGALTDDGISAVDFSVCRHQLGKAGGDILCLTDMQGLIEAGAVGLDLAHGLTADPPAAALLPLSDIHLLSPLPKPAQIRCFSAFEQHARQSSKVMMKIMSANAPDPERALAEFEQSGRFNIPAVFYERPLYYKGNRFSVVGHGHATQWPSYSEVIDYELELAAIIGKAGKDIAAADAQAHIFGYSIFNDLTARDEQAREMVAPLGPAKGKDFDGGNVLGPCIVTADEISNPYNLRMTARINGELWTDGRSDDMAHSFEDMLAYVSRSETVWPGEIFLSGCVGGGCGMEQERYLSRGDLLELEIEGIGVLESRIAL